MPREFIYLNRDGKPSPPTTLAKVLAKAKSRILFGRGPFTFTQDGDILDDNLKRGTVIDRLDHHLSNGRIGPIYRVRNRKGVIFGARETQPAIHVIDTNGNDKIDKVWSAVKAVFPNISFLGAYVCKRIAGTTQLSQHSYGNAVDIGAGSMDQLETIAHWVVAKANELSVEHVIVNKSIWTRGQGWHYYTGITHYHVHVDANPNLSGPCREPS